MIDWEKNSEEILSRALLAGEEGKTAGRQVELIV